MLAGEKTFSELLDEHFDPQLLVSAERFRFYKRSQKPDESIADLIAGLCRLSIKCEFGELLDQALHDCFVCGDAIQMKQLAEAKLTIRRAQEIAQGMECADKDAHLKGGANQRTRTVCAVFKTTSSRETSHKKCYCCGRRHDEKTCKFKEARCQKCVKLGHIAPVCRSGSPPTSHVAKKTDRFYQRRRGGTKWMDADPEGDSESVPLFTLQGKPLDLLF